MDELDPEVIHLPNIYVHRVFVGKNFEKRIEVCKRVAAQELCVCVCVCMSEGVSCRSEQFVREVLRLVEEGRVQSSERGLSAEQLWNSRMACLVSY